ncbi:hypothetical protein GW17_00012637 [Ensete ventricosum]|nr:hypothetical protein GW17_00012637 [Ensete ventricosum]
METFIETTFLPFDSLPSDCVVNGRPTVASVAVPYTKVVRLPALAGGLHEATHYLCARCCRLLEVVAASRKHYRVSTQQART